MGMGQSAAGMVGDGDESSWGWMGMGRKCTGTVGDGDDTGGYGRKWG